MVQLPMSHCHHYHLIILLLNLQITSNEEEHGLMGKARNVLSWLPQPNTFLSLFVVCIGVDVKFL